MIPNADFLPLPVLADEPVINAPAPRDDHQEDHPRNPELLDPEWMQEPAEAYLPDGTRLVLTVHRKLLFLTHFPEVTLYPETYQQAQVLLFLAGNPRTRWNAPVRDPEHGLLSPLHTRPDALKDEIDGWTDRVLGTMHPAAILAQARQLWMGEHRNQVVVPDNSKKNGIVERVLPSIRSSPSVPASPAGMSSATDSSSTSAASGISTPSSMGTSPALG